MILCCGEALIDLVPRPDGALMPRPGGGAFNTALALGRLGAPAGFLWPLGRDDFGDLLHARLAAAGVDTAACPRPDRPTTLALVSLRDGTPRYVFHDAGTAGRLFAPADLPALPDGLAALLVGGIALAAEPCGTTVETLARRAAAAGVPVMLDPNIRPAAIPDAAGLRARLGRLVAQAAMVKLSEEDAAWLWPGTDPAAAAQALLARGPGLVFLTRGAAGATAWTPTHRLTAPAPAVTVADTIGAGDGFNAGLLDALHRGGALARLDDLAAQATDAAPILAAALDHATRVAALCVTRPGADPPWAHELA